MCLRSVYSQSQLQLIWWLFISRLVGCISRDQHSRMSLWTILGTTIIRETSLIMQYLRTAHLFFFRLSETSFFQFFQFSHDNKSLLSDNQSIVCTVVLRKLDLTKRSNRNAREVTCLSSWFLLEIIWPDSGCFEPFTGRYKCPLIVSKRLFSSGRKKKSR